MNTNRDTYFLNALTIVLLLGTILLFADAFTNGSLFAGTTFEMANSFLVTNIISQ